MPQEGASIKNIQKMKADFEVRLAASIEIFATNFENHTFTVVVLPENRPLVGLGNLIDSDDFKNAESSLTVATGINYNGKIILADIEELPHMLIAGTTGSGKTVFLDDLIMSILYKASPEQVRMIMIDPKMVDLTFYNGIPHLLAPVIYDENKMFGMLDWAETEMMRHSFLLWRIRRNGTGIKQSTMLIGTS